MACLCCVQVWSRAALQGRAGCCHAASSHVAAAATDISTGTYGFYPAAYSQPYWYYDANNQKIPLPALTNIVTAMALNKDG
jgi:hypothetical protein